MAKSSKQTRRPSGTFWQRMHVRLELFRWSASQIAAGLGVLAFIGIFVLLPLRFNSPVVKREQTGAVITSIAAIPDRPNRFGNGVSYRYAIKLNGTDAIAFVTDDALRPHSIGAIVEVERRTRANGWVTYHMLPMGL
ncbi:hypothetical protein [Mesorhizobium sp. DCY119]|uniref:hypothetical protein n=2 Tax=Mesorhizobium sp. DCY119 TaxID=2108445 RepID=UPI000E6B9090|nr:hypothetical protein [Mesorhizobium sp. DCY119]RJG46804.1 hypothetical protein D3Y55_22915 [Mesorhizobium sp. DCY119]